MSSSFSQLKQSSDSSLDTLSKELTKLNESTTNNSQDERYWKLTVDKAQNGHAIIRFLPASTGESVPWVRMWSHGFQGPGGWYIENSLTTIGQKDPVSEYNTQLWNSGIESDKELARKQKRKLQYIANIFVVSDPANPDNEGKVFLFKFGKKIFDMVNDKMNPEFPGETSVNPFDLWSGCNFRLRARKVAGYRNYDKSEFSAAKALSDDDAKLETIYNTLYSLAEIVSPTNFKSYEELKAKLNRVLGEEGMVMTTAESMSLEESSPAPQFKAAVEQPITSSAPAAPAEAEEDDTMSYFARLAND